MELRKDTLLQILKAQCNTDNFNSLYGDTATIGFTQKYNNNYYYVSIIDLDNGWIRANVHQYGKSLFDYEMEVLINRKRDLWVLQKTLKRAGIFLPLGIIKKFVK